MSLNSAKVLLIVVGCLLLASCLSMKGTIKDDGKQIPPDFGKKEGTLLVVKTDIKSWDRRLTGHMEKNYFGKYEYITLGDENSKQYDDKVKYRFVFGDEVQTRFDNVIPSNSNYATSRYAFFATKDRLTGNIYKTRFGSGQWSKFMRGYIQALEKARQKK